MMRSSTKCHCCWHLIIHKGALHTLFCSHYFSRLPNILAPQKQTLHFTLNLCFRQSSYILILRNHIEKICEKLGKWLWLLMWQMIHGRPRSPVVCDDMLSSAETKRLPISGELFLGALFSFKNATCLMINLRILPLGKGFTIHLTIFLEIMYVVPRSHIFGQQN